MTSMQVLQVIETYEKQLEAEGFEVERYRWPDKRAPSRRGALNHAMFMCGEIKKFLKDEELEKAFRWLGFLQGALWTHGIYSIDEMRGHNR